MTTRTFQDRSGKSFAVLELRSPAAPRYPDCIGFSLELDSDFGPRPLGGGDLSAADTSALLKVMQDGSGTFYCTPVNEYDNRLIVGAAGGLVTFTIQDHAATRTIRKMSVSATVACEAGRDLMTSLTITKPVPVEAPVEAPQGKPANEWQDRRIAELEQEVKQLEQLIAFIRQRQREHD